MSIWLYLNANRSIFCPTFERVKLYPINLSTFSEMKRTLPSSARRKKKPSMESRWGSPSHRNGGSTFSAPLLTGTSAVMGVRSESLQLFVSFWFFVIHTSRWWRCSRIFVLIVWFVRWKYWETTIVDIHLGQIVEIFDTGGGPWCIVLLWNIVSVSKNPWLTFNIHPNWFLLGLV